jgi:hypothetical protein
LGESPWVDALDYDNAVIRSIHHVEDICVKFALQNYASAGAVFVAYFTDQISLGIAVLVVIGLAAVFTGAIGCNIVRYSLFWKLHRIARNTWLKGQTGLRDALFADKECKEYLEMEKLPLIAFLPVIIINLLPAVVAVVLWLM